jgi:hypothetical protein
MRLTARDGDVRDLAGLADPNDVGYREPGERPTSVTRRATGLHGRCHTAKPDCGFRT